MGAKMFDGYVMLMITMGRDTCTHANHIRGVAVFTLIVLAINEPS
jgi:hypothetical protein